MYAILPNGQKVRTTGTFRVYNGFLCYYGKYAGALRTMKLFEVATGKDAVNQNAEQFRNKARKELERYRNLPPLPEVQNQYFISED